MALDVLDIARLGNGHSAVIKPNHNPFSSANFLISLRHCVSLHYPSQILVDESTFVNWLDPAIVDHPNFDKYRYFNDLRKALRLGGTIWNAESSVRIDAVSVGRQIRINVTTID